MLLWFCNKRFDGGDRIILTSGTEKQETGFGIGHEFLKAFSNTSADLDKNEYVSIGEAAEYAKKVRTVENTSPQISDVSGIGKTSYLFEQNVD